MNYTGLAKLISVVGLFVLLGVYAYNQQPIPEWLSVVAGAVFAAIWGYEYLVKGKS